MLPLAMDRGSRVLEHCRFHELPESSLARGFGSVISGHERATHCTRVLDCDAAGVDDGQRVNRIVNKMIAPVPRWSTTAGQKERIR